MSAPGVVIAGGGLAGFQTAATLREMGYPQRIVIACDEPCPPYHRPPLSKSFLLGDTEDARLDLRSPAFFADKKIELLTGQRVAAIDCVQHRVSLDSGATLDYQHLVLATGARNRLLPVPGADLDGVCYLRTLAEAQVLKKRLREIRRVVVVGAGFIGLEFAMTAAKLGVAATVLDIADRPMARAISPAMAAVFTREHAKCGVTFEFNTHVAQMLESDGRVSGVQTGDGRIFPADLVLIGIGVLPNVELAAACGLEVRNGIVVDDRMRTADPDISAVGDCAAHPSVYAGGAEIRLESVQNATDQARCLASRLCGKSLCYTSTPWFWSDQGDLKLQIAGVTAGCDETVMRGDPATTSCTNFCFKEGRLVGVETVNRPADHMTARRLVGQHIDITPAQAADESVDLKQLLSKAA